MANMLAQMKIFLTLMTLVSIFLVTISILCFSSKENANLKTEQTIFYESFKFSANLFKLNGNSCSLIQRDKFINLLNTDLPTLEIGPFTNPITGKNVKYFDVLDSIGLQNKAVLLSINGSRIPKEIHYISEFGDLTIIKDKFDNVYSSHNIEHQIDLVEYFNQIYDLLNENGKYFVNIPDKRYCFDHFVSETALSDVLSSHFVKTKRHTLKTQLTMCETTHNEAVMHWADNHGYPLDADSRSLDCYIKTVKEFFTTTSYIDSHQWRFQPRNFLHICNSLYKMGLTKLKIEKLYCTQKNSNEFMAILTK